MGETGAFIAYGDQQRERDLGVADGFSGLVIGKDEAMVSREILDILEIAEKGSIQVKYDILTFLP